MGREGEIRLGWISLTLSVEAKKRHLKLDQYLLESRIWTEEKKYMILLCIGFLAATYPFEIQILPVVGFPTTMLSVNNS